MNTLQNHSEAEFSQVAPLLDEAINELEEADRTAILLRFFEQQDFRAVGQALGSNEDAARLRVTRALEKLEEFLKRRGVTTSAASLGVVLTANVVQAAPVGLAVTISTAAVLAGRNNPRRHRNCNRNQARYHDYTTKEFACRDARGRGRRWNL